MATLLEALQIALQHHAAGRLDVAEDLYRRILALQPDQADALHLLGVIAHQRGRPAAAVEYIRRAIALSPSCHAYHYNLGKALRDLGQLDEAAESFQRAIQQAPDHAESHSNLGGVLCSLGRSAEAAVCCRRAIELQPALAEAHSNLGSALKDQGQLEAAGACYERALQLQPEQALFHYNLGTLLTQLGKLTQAAACYRRAVELNPALTQAHINLGSVLQRLGQLDEAITCHQRALQLAPNSAVAHNNLGIALRRHANREGAIACFRRAIQENPDYAEAYSNLGNALDDQGRLDEAIAAYQRSIELRPDLAETHSNLGNAWKGCGRLTEAIACFRHAAQLNPDLHTPHSNLLYTLSFSAEYTAEMICEEHRRWNRQHAAPLAKSIRPHANDRSPDRRLRVGYVAPDFRQHVQSHFTVPLLAAHDHRQFEIFVYADVAVPDDVTARLRAMPNVWRSTAGMTDEQIAAAIRDDRIDILVDLTLHMDNNRLLVFARKPAPVQISWLAYPGTTGVSAIDYRLTDPYLDPPGLYDRLYSEESIRLPETFWCYDPLADGPAVGPLPASQNGYVTFGSLNNFCKVNRSVLQVWAGVVRRVDRSRLMILAPECADRARALETLVEGGVNADRVTFLGLRDRPKYLELYHELDMALDTFPYNGHTTSLDSFWMGVPVVTLVGPTVVGRGGLSQLTNLGLTELIAHSPEQFVRIAVELAGNLPRLAELRRSLRGRLQASPLMDAPRFARNIEAAYRTLWQRWCNGTSPQTMGKIESPEQSV